jgi:RsiW-degrading membrane proteinase PrsW (M82 family)
VDTQWLKGKGAHLPLYFCLDNSNNIKGAGTMRVALIMIAVVSYLIGFFVFVAAQAHQSVPQEIVAAVNFLCGTVSLVGVGVINQLVDIHKRLPDNSPPTAGPVHG